MVARKHVLARALAIVGGALVGFAGLVGLNLVLALLDGPDQPSDDWE